MNDTLATKEDIKLFHDRLNTLTVIMVVGFIFIIGSVVLTRFIGQAVLTFPCHSRESVRLVWGVADIVPVLDSGLRRNDGIG